MGDIKYPEVTVQLSGEDGNAFAVMGRVTKELGLHLQSIGADGQQVRREVATFRDEAMSGDYDHLLQTCMRWVNVE